MKALPALLVFIFMFICPVRTLRADDMPTTHKQDPIADLCSLIEQRSMIRVVHTDAQPWKVNELEAVLNALDRLPDVMLWGKPVLLKKIPEYFTFSENDKALTELTAQKRELSVREIKPDSMYRNITAIDFYLFLQREIIFQLSALYYRSLKRTLKTEWKAFAGWKTVLPGIETALNLNKDGYSAEAAMVSAEYDFASYALDFFIPSPFLDLKSTVRCRLPGRYSFMQKLFPGFPVEQSPVPCSENYPDWINPADVEHIEILVTTPTASSPASVAGHTLFLIKRRQDYHDGSDSIVLGFVGTTAQDSANGISGFRYAWRGLSGYYRSAIMEETLEDLVLRATVLENRDVIRYVLKLNRSEIAGLIERLWVVKNTFTSKYRFFDINCGSMLIDALNFAFAPEEKINLNRFPVPPMYTVAELMRLNRIEGFAEPEYWSISRMARYAYTKNHEIRHEILAILKEKIAAGLPGELYREALRLFDMADETGKSTIIMDSLFREPLLETDTEKRCRAYKGLGVFFSLLHAQYTGSETIFSAKEFKDIAILLIRFFLYADIYEKYIAVPEEVQRDFKKNPNIPAEAAQVLIEEKLRQIRLRRANSQSIRELRLALSKFRNFIDLHYNDPDIYRAGRQIQDEFNASVARIHRNTSYRHGYFPNFTTIGWRFNDNTNYASFTFGKAIYFADMGSKGVFALKQDMKFVLLFAELKACIPAGPRNNEDPAENCTIESRTTLLDIEKVFVPETIQYRGLCNIGLGLRLLDVQSFIWDGDSFFPGSKIESDIIEFKSIINIAEAGGFASYINIKSGAGYSILRHEDDTGHYLTLPLEAEIKIQTGHKMDNALRLSVRYEPFINFTQNWFSRCTAEIQLTLGSGGKSGCLVQSGLCYDFEILHEEGTPRQKDGALSVYVQLKH
ncbi:MAG: DUF4105 domain-containing protein [Spirochaetales bacterium]|nr:DUF4105 domain-containing protein [Spirochaetales bacterium]